MNNSPIEYRVVYKEGHGFAIYQLSKNEKGEYRFVGTTPISPWGGSLTELQSSFARLQSAFQKEVVKFDDIRL